jgi:hypothetical protein
MPRKSAPKRKAPKDTPAKQHARFLEAAKEAGVSDDPKAFDKAVKRVGSPKPAGRQSQGGA